MYIESSRQRGEGATAPAVPRSRLGAALVASVLATTLAPNDTALAFQVCTRSCAPTDNACLAAVAACETKIHAYNIYMGQMGAGAANAALPPIYRELLGPRYPGANLSSYRLAFADRQPANNATTDCATTYFNNQSYVQAVKDAAANPDWFWLLHEVTHAEQCALLGSRDRYAKRWWDEMEAALAARGRTVNVLQTPEQLAGQLGGFFLQVHDSMPMERAADAKGNQVLAALENCCIDRDRRPIRPLQLLAIEDSSDAGSSVRKILRVRTENGDPPLASRWRIKSPGDTGYVEQPANLINGLRLLWTPRTDPATGVTTATATTTSTTWSFDIEVEVSQRNTSLEPQKLRRTIQLGTSSRRPIDGKLPVGGIGPQLPSQLPPPGGLNPSPPAGPGPLPPPGPRPSPPPGG